MHLPRLKLYNDMDGDQTWNNQFYCMDKLNHVKIFCEYKTIITTTVKLFGVPWLVLVLSYNELNF